MAGGRGRESRRTVRRRRRKRLVIAAAVILSAAAGWLAVWLMEVLTRGAEYVRTEKIVTGNSGKKYTIGGAVERVIEKGKEEEEK